MRLQLALARAGVASRRGAEELIRNGQVKVNGRVVTRLGTKVRPGVDAIKVGNRAIAHAAPAAYFLLNKPVGCVSTLSDPEGRFCIGDVIGRIGLSVFAVGRLDYASSGLVLLTNDGALAERLLHPRYGVERTYMAKLSRVPDGSVLARLQRGVRLEDGRARALRARVLRTVGSKAWVEVVIDEGRTRQVRRMFEACGILVEKLRRTRMGPLVLGRLPAGGLRRLQAHEVARLRSAIGVEDRERRRRPS